MLGQIAPIVSSLRKPMIAVSLTRDEINKTEIADEPRRVLLEERSGLVVDLEIVDDSLPPGILALVVDWMPVPVVGAIVVDIGLETLVQVIVAVVFFSELHAKSFVALDQVSHLLEFVRGQVIFDLACVLKAAKLLAPLR